jgi:flavin-binding protein dodecin
MNLRDNQNLNLKEPQVNAILNKKYQKISSTESSPTSISHTADQSILSANQNTTATGYFNPNFDENAYVFDGVKIEVSPIFV